MICIVASMKDIASRNIAENLLSITKWKEKGNIYERDDMLLYFIDDEHIFHDDVDKEIEALGYTIDAIIFASRHASVAKKKTLSIHAIGNFGKAEYGGRDKTLIPCSPLLMRSVLQILKETAPKEYQVCYEATHHGPYLEKPCFFIEVGSTEAEWRDKKACRVIAEAILQMEEKNYEVAIGIGGGHYAPRFTDMALEGRIAFGHIAAKYAVEHLNEEMLKKMVDATPDCKKVCFHGKYERIEEIIRKTRLSIS